MALRVLNTKDTYIHQRYFVVAMLGRRCTGKSTLLNALVRDGA